MKIDISVIKSRGYVGPIGATIELVHHVPVQTPQTTFRLRAIRYIVLETQNNDIPL